MRRKSIPLAIVALTLSASALAAEVNVKFTANIVQPTCDMSLIAYGGSAVTTTGTNTYQIRIPDIRLDLLRAKGADTQANFTLKPANCSGLTALKTTLKAEKVSTYEPVLAVPSVSTGKATNVGVAFRRQSSSSDIYFRLNNDETITWTADERANGLNLSAAMRETLTGSGTTGPFDAKITFNFTYE
ncbi:MAG: fimbrial protein [Hafnia sp.]